MKIVLASGGTAGHTFPALALASELRSQGHDVSFVGVFRDDAERIQAAGYSCEELSARGLRTDQIGSVLVSSVLMIKSTAKSLKVLSRQKPQRIVGFGGYGAFPVVLAGILLRIPTVIHEQNVMPGRANLLLRPWVRKIAVSFEKGLKYFPVHKTVWTGYPLLRKFAGASKADAATQWSLDLNKKTILVLGGSQGSHAINKVFLDAVDLLQDTSNYQVVHASGKEDYDFVKERYARNKMQHHVSPFFEEMGKAYCLADLVISRAGAGTITEIALFQKPCILIPYPHAQQHQRENALVLSEAGNAIIFNEKDISSAQVRDGIIRLLKEPCMKEEVISSLLKLSVADAAQRLAQEVLRVGG